jgi:hypothetical protein
MELDPRTGDTLLAGQPLSSGAADTAGYAAHRTWFLANEPFFFNGQPFVKIGLSQVVEATSLKRVGEYSGVALFADTAASWHPETLYVPVRRGCIFQAYQNGAEVGSVRG